ncbi:MAG: ribosomal protection-like ABC-F family protein [Candidatus Kapaibacterium sp.]
MITLSHISIRFGGHALFDDITATIGTRDRVGLVGKNGAGKSSLLKLIARQQRPDEGEITTPNGYTIAYLAQDMVTRKGFSVYDEIASHAFARHQYLDARLHQISDELSSRTDYESDDYAKLLHELSDVNDEFLRIGGTTMRAEIETVMSGLGFSTADMDRLCDEFSGGWQMRIELGKILLSKPQCILLDEPTNHLDIESIQWLEQFLKNYDGSVVLVSHDRAFLDAVTTRTIEITNGHVEDYPVPYTKYVDMRAERRAQLESAYENQQRDIAQQEKFIERFRSKANLATRVQSRIKQLEKIDRIELEDEDTSAIAFRFPPAPRSGRVVFETIGLGKSYGTKNILGSVDLALERGDRIAFVGKNGEGKTTLSKIIAGRESHTGTLTIGHNVSIGYFEQHQAEALDGDATAFDVIDAAAAGEMRTKVRSLLGAFLFSGDAVYKKVRVLSGGEKSRLDMAKLLLEPVNLLILDDPTNHLDMRSKDVLKQALMAYEGSLVVVSHDREFLQGLTNKVFEFRGGAVKEYTGDIYGYLQARQIENLRELEKSSSQKAERVKAEKAERQKADQVRADNAGTKENREEQKNKERELRKHTRALEDCEARIAELEKRMAEIDTKLADASFYSSADAPAALAEHRNVQQELDEKMKTWNELAHMIESMQAS